jgi:hypothetical protein
VVTTPTLFVRGRMLSGQISDEELAALQTLH